jgi:tetrapyrrole methylase family protein/MazG family protein
MNAFQKFYDVIVKLRSPEGCAWDREQTPQSLRGALIEETYECIEAINLRDSAHTKEELGDIFLLVTMIAYMHEQAGDFSVADTLEAVAEKLVRRHPHVFDPERNTGAEKMTAAQTLEKWAQIKVEQEGRKPKDSILDEVPQGFPPLDKAFKLQKKAAKVGFDWQSAADVTAKVREELAEVEAEIRALETCANTNAPAERSALEGELGDLLFSAINLCRFFKVDPSTALARTNTKFTERFKHVESRMKERGVPMSAEHLPEMERYWNEAKGM